MTKENKPDTSETRTVPPLSVAPGSADSRLSRLQNEVDEMADPHRWRWTDMMSRRAAAEHTLGVLCRAGVVGKFNGKYRVLPNVKDEPRARNERTQP
jgi:hypothetical protein